MSVGEICGLGLQTGIYLGGEGGSGVDFEVVLQFDRLPCLKREIATGSRYDEGASRTDDGSRLTRHGRTHGHVSEIQVKRRRAARGVNHRVDPRCRNIGGWLEGQWDVVQ